jgi:negative regulator of sigma-B (phosphoserine phosphatase)
MAAPIAATSVWLDWAVAWHALNDAECSGDIHLVVPHSRGVIVGVADGLGHGPEAALAARKAALVCELNAERTLTELMTLCHEALRHTRGAVLSLASFQPAAGMIDRLGVGNVEGILIRAPTAEDSRGPGLTAGKGKVAYESLRLHGGVVGYQIPTLRPSTFAIRGGDVVILATDGVRSGFGRAGSGISGCQEMADTILSEYSRLSDDALVLVIRYLGRS